MNRIVFFMMFGFFLLSCVREEETDFRPGGDDGSGYARNVGSNGLPPKNADLVSDWGLNQNLRTDGTGPGSVSCVNCGFAGCDCYDDFYVIGMNAEDKNRLDEVIEAIDNDNVHGYFNDLSNSDDWNQLFNGQISNDVLSDLQSGLTTLIWFSEDDGATITIAIQYADGTDHPGY
jgi:hypothetical protein